MKRIKLTLLALPVFVLLLTSCNKKDDPAVQYADWKVKNDTYFTSMKDSTAYTLYTIPANRGGGSFYYKVTKAGQTDSISPQYYDFVVVNYRGKLIDGTVFDQTYTGVSAPTDSTAHSAGFYVIALVPGWVENLLQMKPGEKRTFVLPQQLAYGSTGMGLIHPYSVTVWEVELVKVYRATKTSAPTLKSDKRSIVKGEVF